MGGETILIMDVYGNWIEVPIEEVSQKINEPTVAEYTNENNINKWKEEGGDNGE